MCWSGCHAEMNVPFGSMNTAILPASKICIGPATTCPPLAVTVLAVSSTFATVT